MERSNTYLHAKRELTILSASCKDPENRPVIEDFTNELLELCDRFGKSGQSGGSAPFTATSLAHAIKKLCLQEPICPITGVDEEWTDIAEINGGVTMYQNNRCSAIFRDNTGDYYIDAVVFKDQFGSTFTCGGNGNVEGVTSRQYIKEYPFTPKTFYIDVFSTEVKPGWWEHTLVKPKQTLTVKRYYKNISIMKI